MRPHATILLVKLRLARDLLSAELDASHAGYVDKLRLPKGILAMDGVLRPDAANFIAIGLTAFIMVWLVDRGLRKIGWNAWTTTGS